MQRNRQRHVGALLVASVALGVLSPTWVRDEDRSVQSLLCWLGDERARVQVHLAGAERVLLAADTRHLTAEQRGARERNIALLRDYRERAAFPQNVDHPEGRTPCFVDDRGVPCAMAHLLLSAGRVDIVDRVRITQNDARILELASDVDLVMWLESAGLSVVEAARIQPEYGYHPAPAPIKPAITPGDAVASAMTGLLNGGAVIWVATSPPNSTRWRGLLPAATGTLALALGAAKMDDEGDPKMLGAWNAATGTLALCVGAYTLLHGSDTENAPVVMERSPLQLTPRLGPEPGVQLVLTL